MLRIDVLLAALLVSSPTLYEALVTGNTSVDTALIRFLIAVPVCAVGLWVVRRLFAVYTAQQIIGAVKQAHDAQDALASSGSGADHHRRRDDPGAEGLPEAG